MKFLYLMKFMNLFKGRLVRSLQILICYLVMSLAAPLHAAENSDISGYVMHVQMTPAACSFDSSRQKQRKCLEGYSLTIASLLPEVPLIGIVPLKLLRNYLPCKLKLWRV